MGNNERWLIEKLLKILTCTVDTPISEAVIPDNESVKVLCTAVRLPSGAIEVAVNTENLADKARYILEAYDSEMRLKTNPKICMVGVMYA